MKGVNSFKQVNVNRRNLQLKIVFSLSFNFERFREAMALRVLYITEKYVTDLKRERLRNRRMTSEQHVTTWCQSVVMF